MECVETEKEWDFFLVEKVQTSDGFLFLFSWISFVLCPSVLGKMTVTFPAKKCGRKKGTGLSIFTEDDEQGAVVRMPEFHLARFARAARLDTALYRFDGLCGSRRGCPASGNILRFLPTLNLRQFESAK